MAEVPDDRDEQSSDVSRRRLLAGAGGLVGAALLPVAARVASAAPGGLNGIGLTRAQFTERYGTPRVGQGASVYEVGGNNFYVTNTSTVDTDRVVSVYWGGTTADDTAPLNNVRSRLSEFLPNDAVLIEVCDAPAAGIGPRLLVDVYRSSALSAALLGSGFIDSGNMLIAYVFVPGYEPIVSWANLYVGVKPGN